MSEYHNQSEQLLLSRCDLAKCEAMCCHDGVYLMPGEETFLVELVELLPELKSILPEDFVVDGFWRGDFYGRKTATRLHEYRNPNYPAHFPKTRCVFADSNGLCELEKLARRRKKHPWTFKPAACWLFPLNVETGEPVPPPNDKIHDPYRTDDYPGYVTYVPCGHNDPSGKPWSETLKDELSYLKSLDSIPVIGAEGHSASDLLKDE
jgi:hypothetical protein